MMKIHNGKVLAWGYLLLCSSAAFIPLSIAPITAVTALMVFWVSKKPGLLKCSQMSTTWILIALIGWMIFGLWWSADFQLGLKKLPRLIIILVLGVGIIAAALRLTNAERGELKKYILPGFLILLTTISIGLLFKKLGLLEFFMGTNASAVGPETDASSFNRGTTVLVLCLLPTLLMTIKNPWGRFGILILSGLPLILTDSNAAILGFLASLVTLGLCKIVPKIGFYATFTCLIIYALTAPALHQIDSDLNINETKFLFSPLKVSNFPKSAKHRIVIWDFASKKILERPILGWGFNTSPGIAKNEDSSAFGGHLPLHPHNAVLQIWLELGLIGVLLFISLLVAVAWRLRYFNPWPDRGICVAFLVSSFSMSSVAYGIWQTWWISALFFSTALLIATLPRGDRVEDGK